MRILEDKVPYEQVILEERRAFHAFKFARIKALVGERVVDDARLEKYYVRLVFGFLLDLEDVPVGQVDRGWCLKLHQIAVKFYNQVALAEQYELAALVVIDIWKFVLELEYDNIHEILVIAVFTQCV